MVVRHVGEGKVVLIAGGGKIYTDVAARFCRSEKDLESIIGSPYNKKIVEHIINSGHNAALEFDWFIFGVEGYSRVTETQLVRKRHASYMIKSGRVEFGGKRSFDVVLPTDEKINLAFGSVDVDLKDIILSNQKTGEILDLADYVNSRSKDPWMARVRLNNMQILEAIEDFYNSAVRVGVKEEDARYYKPQATMFRAVIGMNAAALKDWFRIRTCNRAQTEIRDLATKMMKLCKEAAPDLFVDAGPNCVRLGLCPELEQCEQCKGKIMTLKEFKEINKKVSIEQLRNLAK